MKLEDFQLLNLTVKLTANGEKIEKKTTVYAVHNKLREIDEEIAKGKCSAFIYR